MKHYTLLILWALLLAGCTTKDDGYLDEGMTLRNDLTTEYYGCFEGFWTTDAERIGEASVQMGDQQVFSSLPWFKTIEQAVAANLGTHQITIDKADAYRVHYRKIGFSAGSLYFNISADNYSFKILANNKEHLVQLVMDPNGAVAVYDKQTDALVALFIVNEVKVDDVTVVKFNPGLNIQFNSTKKIQAGGV